MAWKTPDHKAVGEYLKIKIIEKNKGLTINSDDFGFKPVYYHYDENYLYLGKDLSDLKDINRDKLELSSIRYFLKYRFIPSGKSIKKDVFRLGPDQKIMINEHRFSIISKKEMLKKIDITYNQAVKRMEEDLIKYFEKLKKDRVNIMYSGGIDSTLLIIAAVKAGKKVNTFSVDIGLSDFSEKRYRGELTKRFNTNHKEFLLEKESYLDTLNRLYSNEGISYIYQDTAAFVWLIEQAGLKGEDIIFGLGADEWFFGYDRMAFSYLERTFQKMIQEKGLKNEPFDGLAGIMLGEINERANSLFNYIDPIFKDEKLDELLFKKNHTITGDDDYYYDDMIRKIIDFERYQEFPYNQAVRLNSIERATDTNIILPFLQKDILRIAYSLDFDRLVNNGRKKNILYDLFIEFLPDKIRNRKKNGFKIPLEEWSDNDLLFKISKKMLAEKHDRINSFFKKDISLLLSEKFFNKEQLWYLFMLFKLI